MNHLGTNRTKKDLTNRETSFKVDKNELRCVFRRTAPYIVREWKDVCLELGITQAEIEQIQDSYPQSCLSHLAYLGLCLWLEKCGPAANKKFFIEVLKDFGLRRAIDEVGTFESLQRTGRPATCFGTSRTPLKPSDRPRTPKTNTRIKNASISLRRPKTAKSVLVHSSNVDDNSRVKSAKRRGSLSPKSEICEVCVQVRASKITPIESAQLNTAERTRAVLQNFYNVILNRREQYAWNLETALGIPGVSLQGLHDNGIGVYLSCPTLGILETINQMYITDRLQKIFHHVMVNERVLQHAEATSVELQVCLDEDAITDCQDKLLARKLRSSSLSHPTDSLRDPMQEPSFDHLPLPSGCDYSDSIDNDFNQTQWKGSLQAEVLKFQEQLQTFDNSREELVRTLQIVLPTDVTTVSGLSDLIDLNRSLANSVALSSAVRSDLIREFLSLLNKMRLFVEAVKRDIFKVSFSSQKQKDLAFYEIRDLEIMMEPTYTFDVAYLDRKFSVIEKPFSGLLSFLPRTLKRIVHLVENLPSSDFDPSQ